MNILTLICYRYFVLILKCVCLVVVRCVRGKSLSTAETVRFLKYVTRSTLFISITERLVVFEVSLFVLLVLDKVVLNGCEFVGGFMCLSLLLGGSVCFSSSFFRFGSVVWFLRFFVGAAFLSSFSTLELEKVRVVSVGEGDVLWDLASFIAPTASVAGGGGGRLIIFAPVFHW